jgi:hypothetical protein
MISFRRLETRRFLSSYHLSGELNDPKGAEEGSRVGMAFVLPVSGSAE